MGIFQLTSDNNKQQRFSRGAFYGPLFFSSALIIDSLFLRKLALLPVLQSNVNLVVRRLFGDAVSYLEAARNYREVRVAMCAHSAGPDLAHSAS